MLRSLSNCSSLVSRLPKVSFIADIISATVMIKTDFPRSSSSLQMAAARWFCQCPVYRRR